MRCKLDSNWESAFVRQIPNPTLRWGWVFLERMRILSGIQFTTHFIEIFVVETQRFVGSFVNVILTRQTCGQRSSRAAEIKRWALGNYFSKSICYMFLMSKCRGDWDLGLCTFWVLAKREPLCNGDFWKKKCFACRKNRNLALRTGSPKEKIGIRHCAAKPKFLGKKWVEPAQIEFFEQKLYLCSQRFYESFRKSWGKSSRFS